MKPRNKTSVILLPVTIGVAGFFLSYFGYFKSFNLYLKGHPIAVMVLISFLVTMLLLGVSKTAGKKNGILKP